MLLIIMLKTADFQIICVYMHHHLYASFNVVRMVGWISCENCIQNFGWETSRITKAYMDNI